MKRTFGFLALAAVSFGLTFSGALEAKAGFHSFLPFFQKDDKAPPAPKEPKGPPPPPPSKGCPGKDSKGCV